MATRAACGAAIAAALLLSACGGDDGAEPAAAPTSAASSPSSQSSSAPAAASPSAAGSSSSAPVDSPPRVTAKLDSVAVIGHSGATGTVSDPTDPTRDASENSWATGDNPEVRSIYRRLLATHPALEGHNYNAAINGTRVTDLDFQIDTLLQDVEVVPDLVLIQTIDNDMACDGTDAQNFAPFGRTLDRALTRIEREFEGAATFIVSQWAEAETWATWAQHVPGQVPIYSGTGPCDVFDEQGRLRPAGIASMQAISDGYWDKVVTVCARHPRCATDGGAETREFVPTDADVALDNNHLSIRGHAKFAAIAWDALPDEIKQAR